VSRAPRTEALPYAAASDYSFLMSSVDQVIRDLKSERATPGRRRPKHELRSRPRRGHRPNRRPPALGPLEAMLLEIPMSSRWSPENRASRLAVHLAFAIAGVAPLSPVEGIRTLAAVEGVVPGVSGQDVITCQAV
jgi:hypothetical protein